MAMKKLVDAVAEQITKLGPSTKKALIEARVQRVLNQRVTALDQLWEKMDRLNKEINKVRPDQESVDEEGEAVGTPTYSKHRFQELKKLKEQLQKLEKAAEKALEKGDFGDVFNFTDNPKPSTEAGN